jgi:hypothetical protein
MLVASTKGVPIGVARVRYLLGKPNTDGRTVGSDLVRVLALCHINSHERDVDAATALYEVRHNLGAGRSSIVLGFWITPGVSHWMLAIQDMDGMIMFDDPWIGAHRVVTDADFLAKYDGQYVHLDQ